MERREKRKITELETHEKLNKPCLTKKPCFYACNAPSNASLSGNIWYLVGLLHRVPATSKKACNFK